MSEIAVITQILFWLALILGLVAVDSVGTLSLLMTKLSMVALALAITLSLILSALVLKAHGLP